MSLLPRRPPDDRPDDLPDDLLNTPADFLFSLEARRGGRPVALLRAVQMPHGVTVETEVHRAATAPGERVVQRPFAFPSAAQARRFGEEALTTLEYLGCSVSWIPARHRDG